MTLKHIPKNPYYIDEQTLKEAIAEVMKGLRAQLRITRGEMARELGMPPSRLRTVELASSSITLYDYKTANQYFGMDILEMAESRAAKIMRDRRKVSPFEPGALKTYNSPFGHLPKKPSSADIEAAQLRKEHLENLERLSKENAKSGPFIQNFNTNVAFEVDEDLGNLSDAQLAALNEAETLKYIEEDDSIGNKYL